MGEVYRARDTRLNRTVAIKILPPELSSDKGTRYRFEREARAISSLTHPNICTLYDVGREGETDFLVMEYCDGKPLQGPYPIDHALRLAVQIADALDAAHRQGVVHRDLKPANILVSKSGIKLLDFGLAKFAEGHTEPVAAGASSIATQAITSQGAIIGTFQYMSPEQLEGKEADARTDIFAFGAVLYELVTGKAAFNGASQASLISAIMTGEPQPMSALEPVTPPALEWIVRKCLAKDPEERWQSARDVKAALELVAETGPKQPRNAAARNRWTIAAAGLFGAIALLFGGLYFRSAPEAGGEPTRLSVLMPKGYRQLWSLISPDGLTLAFTAANNGAAQIWLRPLDSLNARPLAGAEDVDGGGFFWSPDSRSIGFFRRDGRLVRIELSTGTVRDISKSPGVGMKQGAWGSGNRILFTDPEDGRIFSVPASGGTPVPVTTVDKSRHLRHMNAQFLPDGSRFLYSAMGRTPENGELLLGSLDAKPEDQPLAMPTPSGRWLYVQGDPGYLLFLRDGALLAQRFNVERMRLEGDPVQVAESAGFMFSVSNDGVLAYSGRPSGLSQLQWTDRSGAMLQTVGEPRLYLFGPALSPDGGRVAFALRQGEFIGGRTASDIWIQDLTRPLLSRLTFEGGSYPVWSSDGRRIVSSVSQRGVFALQMQPSDGSGGAERILESPRPVRPLDWSHDGKYLLFAQRPASGAMQWDLWILPLEGDRKPYAFLETRFDESSGRISPDGRWIAYTSTETGRPEVYVQGFPGIMTGKWQISNGGGSTPAWSTAGPELFYRAGREILAVGIHTSGQSLAPQAPSVLADFPEGASDYCAAPDGKRFLIAIPVEQDDARPIHIVQNWRVELTR
jgi:Tol biopolymer transport system component